MSSSQSGEISASPDTSPNATVKRAVNTATFFYYKTKGDPTMSDKKPIRTEADLDAEIGRAHV